MQNGKVPGVYTDWPSAQAQISGFRNPKHKKFTTRAEAESFVQAGKKNLGLDSAQALSPEEEIRRLIVRNSAPGLVINGTHQPKDKEGNPYPLGEGPLPPGAEDGYDPNLKLSSDGTIIEKTQEEKLKTKTMVREKDPPSMLRIYTDGSSLRNGQAGARAGVGVYFGPQDPKYANSTHSSSSSSYPPTPSSSSTTTLVSSTTVASPPPPPEQMVYTIDWVARGAPPPSKKKRKLTNWRYRNVSEALKGSRQTNQRAELTAVQRALDIAPRHRDVTIYTDSKYAIDCATNWYRNWERNGWVTAKGKAVENKDLVQGIRESLNEREEMGKETYFVWVKGHANDEGNIQADRLANEGARLGRGVDDDGTGEDEDDGGGSVEGGSVGESEDGMVDGTDKDVKESWEAMEQAMAAEKGEDDDHNMMEDGGQLIGDEDVRTQVKLERSVV